MIIQKIETWWVRRNKCLFDDKRKGKSAMDWNIDRHLTFFPVYLPGPIDVALWDICAKAAGLPLYQYLGAYREQLPVYASGLFHPTEQEYIDEALYYKSKGIKCYKVHPCGPCEMDMQIHQHLRDAVGDDFQLMSDPVAEYTLDEAIRVGRQLERLNYVWLEEPFRDFELYKYTQLCEAQRLRAAATGVLPRSSTRKKPTSCVPTYRGNAVSRVP